MLLKAISHLGLRALLGPNTRPIFGIQTGVKCRRRHLGHQNHAEIFSLFARGDPSTRRETSAPTCLLDSISSGMRSNPGVGASGAVGSSALGAEFSRCTEVVELFRPRRTFTAVRWV